MPRTQLTNRHTPLAYSQADVPRRARTMRRSSWHRPHRQPALTRPNARCGAPTRSSAITANRSDRRLGARVASCRGRRRQHRRGVVPPGGTRTERSSRGVLERRGLIPSRRVIERRFDDARVGSHPGPACDRVGDSVMGFANAEVTAAKNDAPERRRLRAGSRPNRWVVPTLWPLSSAQRFQASNRSAQGISSAIVRRHRSRGRGDRRCAHAGRGST